MLGDEQDDNFAVTGSFPDSVTAHLVSFPHRFPPSSLYPTKSPFKGNKELPLSQLMKSITCWL